MPPLLNVRFGLRKNVINLKIICKSDFSHSVRIPLVWESYRGAS